MTLFVPQRVEDMLARLEREFGGNYTTETEANWPWWNKGMSKVVGYQNRISVIFGGDEIASFSFSDPINAELFIRAYIAQENCDED